tara:strand:- start:214 stop:393 length:180 start_codon:yes stop_codon:yes gene_type:complete
MNIKTNKMNKEDKKFLNKIFNDYLYDYYKLDNNLLNPFMNNEQKEVVGKICDFMKTHKI